MRVMPTHQMSFRLTSDSGWNVKSLTADVATPVTGQPITWVIAGPLTTELVPGTTITHVLTLGSQPVWTQDTDVGEIVRLPVSPSSSWALTYTFTPPADVPPFADISSELSMTNGDGRPVASFQTTFTCAPG
jgi:hypothetical protein